MTNKLLFFIADSSQTGAPVQVAILAKALHPELKLACLCPSGWLYETLKTAGIEVITLKSDQRSSQVESLKEAISEYQPTLVHAHGVRAGIVTGKVFSRPQNCKLIYTEHLWTNDYSLANPLRQYVQLRLLRKMARQADQVVAVSKAVADFLVAKEIVPRDKCQVIYNAVEPIEPVTTNNETVIGTLGSLNKTKGVDLIIVAAKQLSASYPELKVRIMGNGTELSALKNLASKLGLNNIEFVGQGTDQTIRPFFQSLKVYVQASYSESFGLATLEAMSAGLPVVVSNAGALPELVKNKQTGLIFDRGDSNDLAIKLKMLLDDPVLYTSLQLQGQQFARQFTVSKMALQYKHIYSKI